MLILFDIANISLNFIKLKKLKFSVFVKLFEKYVLSRLPAFQELFRSTKQCTKNTGLGTLGRF